MPRRRLLAQIEEELINAQQSLKFWRDQAIFMSDSELQVAAQRHIMHREADIRRLLEAHEILLKYRDG